MAKSKLPPIHPDFERWYDPVSFGNDEACRQLRWAGVCAVVQAVNSDFIEALVRLAFKSRQSPSGAQLQSIREFFKVADSKFNMETNDRELQILAAASLASVCRDGGELGAGAALAICTTSLAGARKPDLPFNLQVLANTALKLIAQTNQTRPDFGNISETAPKLDFKEASEKVKTQTDAAGISQAFLLAANSVNVVFSQLTQQQAATLKVMKQILQVQDEELQMLSWLMGQRSFDFDCTFDKVCKEAQPILFAKELAEITKVLPGPASLTALLSRAGLLDNDANKITVPSAINAIEPAWKRELVGEGEPSPVTTPLHFAIKRQLDTGEKVKWIPGWAATVGVEEAFSLSPLSLGILFYQERLLLIFSGE